MATMATMLDLPGIWIVVDIEVCCGFALPLLGDFGVDHLGKIRSIALKVKNIEEAINVELKGSWLKVSLDFPRSTQPWS